MLKTVMSRVMLAMTFLCSSAFGQDYPSKPIRIVATEPGGSLDFAARILAHGLSSNLRESVIVENRSGAGGIIAVETVKNAGPDGYTLLFHGSAFWTVPLLQTAPYDPVKDFAPVVMAVTSPNVVVVNPSLPANSVKELIALAKSKPGELNYGASATGSGPHLAGELFKAMTGVNIVRVPYKGGAPTVTDLLAGRLQFAFTTPGTVAKHLKAGKLRALAVTSARPSALFPDLPTVAETVPGYEAATTQGLFAPARVPRAIVNRLNKESVQVLTRQDVKEKFLNSGAEVVANSPEQFSAVIKSEMAKLRKLIKDAGMRSN